MTPSLDALLDLHGTTAIVTGGAKGIGKGIAARLHEAGAAVVVADLDIDAARATVAEFEALRPGSAMAQQADVSNAASVDAMVRDTVERFGGVDVLVNNAGIFPAVPLAEMTENDFMKVIGVNLDGVFLCTKAASTQMIKQGRGGKIINVTSIDALHPSMIGLAQYDASKHGVWGFTKNVAIELAQHQIWVNAIAPGGIVTPGVESMQSGETVDPAVIEQMIARVPMHRFGDPDEIGRVALFLASGLSSYMTGSQIVVDGGLLLM